ncbi:hypothetical protein LSH36_26g15094 [Paralvinella palmiformis]|uniref:Uncharacterized protein n=1 Tax=Paralvinella palmiformis TaxID=53620 RepID=A0AAD9NF11_9ANNE|nr:hypothetical protein LSH36_26g15094 [Paralvinella palmiformis]
MTTSSWKEQIIHVGYANQFRGQSTEVELRSGSKDDMIPGKVDIHEAGCTPLHYAAANGYLVIVRHLLEYGNASISIKTKKGHTARHMAKTRSQTKMVALLSEIAQIDPSLRQSLRSDQQFNLISENQMEGSNWLSK